LFSHRTKSKEHLPMVHTGAQTDGTQHKKLKQLTGRPTMYIIDRWATTRITAQAVQS
jgi:hypothetical protein